MSDWEDCYGRGDAEPWNSPSWNADWEISLISDGCKTTKQWNMDSRIVKKGERGIKLPYLGLVVFSFEQTKPVKNYFNGVHSSDDSNFFYFSTFKKASEWAKKNPEMLILRAPDGIGFIVKP